MTDGKSNSHFVNVHRMSYVSYFSPVFVPSAAMRSDAALNITFNMYHFDCTCMSLPYNIMILLDLLMAYRPSQQF